MKLPTEHDEQAAFAEYLDSIGQKYIAVPNGTYTASIRARVKAKKEGVKKGFPDLVIFAKNSFTNLLIIEMKRTKGGKLSDEQKEWIQFLDGYGLGVATAKGFNEAINVYHNYLKM